MVEPAGGKKLPHLPVLYQQSIKILQPESPGRYLDGTLGAGGHAEGILKASQPEGQLLGLDVDNQALAIAKSRLKPYDSRTILVKGSYGEMGMHLRNARWDCVNGIILDLGLSSMQLDTAERGFSFIKDAPLDMRFNRENELSAEEILNEWSEKELAEIIWKFGEEPRSRRIAAAIVTRRPLKTTRHLTELIEKVYGGIRGKVHPATRTFQAIRMAVNQELDTLEKGLNEAIYALCAGGKLVIISFHSLEDRMVKQFFQREGRDCVCPPEQPVCTCEHKASIRIITKRPMKPTQEEIEKNPRSRSAKLRAAEKI